MRFNQVVALIRRRDLDVQARALAAMIWLTMKRPEHLRFPVGNVSFKSSQEIVIWLPDDKNMAQEEDWRCKTIVMGPFRDILVESWWERRRDGKDAEWFTKTGIGRLMKLLAEIPVKESHRLLRTKYTLFSLRRGAIQHCRAQGLVPEEIVVMSDHRSLGSLALYIGAFLSVECEKSAIISRALTQPAEVPSEYPQGIHPQHRNEPIVPETVRLMRRPRTPVPSAPTSPLRLRSGTVFGAQ
jgi:hypothetical protein